MVVGGDRREPALPSGVNRLFEAPKRKPFGVELHQRQVHPKIHTSIVSGSVRRGSVPPPGDEFRLLLPTHCYSEPTLGDRASQLV